MITDYVGKRTNEDPKCPLCKLPVETHHTPASDRITRRISHDYCLRTESIDHFRNRQREALAATEQAMS